MNTQTKCKTKIPCLHTSFECRTGEFYGWKKKDDNIKISIFWIAIWLKKIFLYRILKVRKLLHVQRAEEKTQNNINMFPILRLLLQRWVLITTTRSSYCSNLTHLSSAMRPHHDHNKRQASCPYQNSKLPHILPSVHLIFILHLKPHLWSGLQQNLELHWSLLTHVKIWWPTPLTWTQIICGL